MAYQMIRAWIPDFNPHSPCGERPPYRPRCRIKARFQSTLPLRGATETAHLRITEHHISIHTPLAGSDSLLRGVSIICAIFQSTLPLRGATINAAICGAAVLFQSTLPLRGATLVLASRTADFVFQSTLPLRGATQARDSDRHGSAYFNPHSPCGERLMVRRQFSRSRLISIHTPLAGSDV